MIAEIELRLAFWGHAYGVHLPKDDEDQNEPDGASSIARVAVDRSRESQAVYRPPRAHLDRTAPIARRRIQKQLGEGVLVPYWAGGDPIRAPRSTGYGSCPPGEAFPDADEIEAMVLDLQRWDRRAALALRAHYCLRGRRPLSERIGWVAEKSEMPVSRMNYRAALARGRVQVWKALQNGGKKTG